MEEEMFKKLSNSETIDFNGWNINYVKSNILKSICVKGHDETCIRGKDDPCCDLCMYRYSLDLPHLPDMVFHKNQLSLVHENGAKLEFLPMEALKLVESGKPNAEDAKVQVACAQEWKESRPEGLTEEKFKPFDWTFTTDYQGTINEHFRVEDCTEKLNKFKLMQREKILFYHDLALFEDELHDNGVSALSVKIRVMPSGFYILLRHFLRVDNVVIKMHDTRFHYETENNYILKEFTKREGTYEELKAVPPALYTLPNEMENFLPLKASKTTKLHFK